MLNHTFRRKNPRPTIGVFNKPFESTVHQLQWLGAIDAAQEHDANLIYFPGHELRNPDLFRAQANILYDLIDPERIDGLIVFSECLNPWITPAEMEAFIRHFHPLPVVSVEITFEGIPGVLVDNYQSMRQVMVHLIEVHGYRRIAFIRGPEGHFGAQERYRAYTETLRAYGLSVEPDLITPPGGWISATGTEAIQILFEQRKLRPHADVEAVVTVGDLFAFSAMQALQAKGIGVPDDIAIASFDDFEAAKAMMPPLTTIRPPFYELGWQAVELILALLAGEDIPESMTVPARLMVRQSCGCQSEAVLQAAGSATIADAPCDVVIVAQQEEVLTEMARAVGDSEKATDWLERFLEGFVMEAKGTSPGIFLQKLKEILQQVSTAHADVAAWQNVLSVLRRHVLPALMQTPALFARFDGLWQQARVLIGETVEQVQAYQNVQAEQQAQIARELEAALITTFDVEKLMDVLADGLPRLGFPGAYLALYVDPAEPADWSQIVLAYHEQGRIALASEGRRFPSRHLIPEGIFPQQRAYSLVVEPLYFRDTQIGFGVFEVGPRDGNIYEILRGQISSALQGALLMQRVQEHAHELAAAYEEIRILNHQLQEENLRMSAELDVSRRIQQMVLPSPEELQQIEGLDVVGYMKPADEVGGDYYDVLKENGMIHIGIGDVTGHGLESGVLMLMTQTAIRTLIEHGETDPVVFLDTLNRIVYKNLQRMKVDKTLTLAFVNYQNGFLKIIGQHEEMLVVRQGGQVVRVDTLNLGFPLGLEEHISDFVAEATISLQPGDSVVLYTDGITEAENVDKQLYGIERLCEVISQQWNQSAEAIKQAVIDDVMQHIGQQKVYDDLTLVVLKQK